MGMTQDDEDALVARNLARNYGAHFIHGVLGLTGFRLVFAPTFVPAYLYTLTQSTVIVGLGSALLYLGAICSPLIWATHLDRRTRILPTAAVSGSLMCLQILLLALSAFMLTGTAQTAAALLLIFTIGFFTGAQRVTFQALFAKLIPLARRGRLQGWRNMAGGALSAGTALAAGTVLLRGGAAESYAMVFLLAFILTATGIAGFALIREHAHDVVAAPPGYFERLRMMPGLLRADPAFSLFLAIQSLAMASRLAAPFYILYAGAQHGLDGWTIGLLSFGFMGADTIANVIWGHLGDRFGFRVPLAASMALSFASTALLLSTESLPLLFAAFAGLGAATSGYLMSALLIILEFGPRSEVPMRLAISTMVEGSFAAIAPLIGGLLMLWAGFSGVFALSMALSCSALLLTLLRFRDPRHRAKETT